MLTNKKYLVVFGIFLIFVVLITITKVEVRNKSPGLDHFISPQYVVGKIINAEANTTDIKDMFLVGSVVYNRLHSQKFPDTTKEVVHQSGQFIGTKNKQFKYNPVTHTVAVLLYWGINRRTDILYFTSRLGIKDKKFKYKLSRMLPRDSSSVHYFWGGINE